MCMPVSDSGYLPFLHLGSSRPGHFSPLFKRQLLSQAFRDTLCMALCPHPSHPSSLPVSLSATCTSRLTICMCLVAVFIDSQPPSEYKLHERTFPVLLTAVALAISEYLSNECMVPFCLYHKPTAPGQQKRGCSPVYSEAKRSSRGLLTSHSKQTKELGLKPVTFLILNVTAAASRAWVGSGGSP